MSEDWRKMTDERKEFRKAKKREWGARNKEKVSEYNRKYRELGKDNKEYQEKSDV